jgi:hypothetical protein
MNESECLDKFDGFNCQCHMNYMTRVSCFYFSTIYSKLMRLFQPGVRWRDPDLHEVIAFLNNPNAVVKANAAAYLQHLCYNSDPVKQQTRLLGGIPLLVGLISSEQPDVHRNACGALR